MSSAQRLQWGCELLRTDKPHNDRVRAFCALDSRLYASADPEHVVFWSNSGIIGRANLQARALCPFHTMNHVAAYVAGSTHLYFIRNRFPFQIRTHPLHFSNKLIVSMFFFEKASILVCAGHGIMVSRVSFPKQFDGHEPVIEALQFGRVTELYGTTKFTNPLIPCFVERMEVFLVPVDRSLFIHTANGAIKKELCEIGSSEITSISFFQRTALIVIGTSDGKVKIVQYETWIVVCERTISVKPIVAVAMIDNNFMVSVDSVQAIRLTHVKSGMEMQRLNTPQPFEVCHIVNGNLIFRVMSGVQVYNCRSCLETFCDVSGFVGKIVRCPSVERAARILCCVSDDEIMLIDPKNGKSVFHIKVPTTKLVMYPRDVAGDGAVWHKTGMGDICFIVTHVGGLIDVAFDQINKLSANAHGQLVSMIPGFDAAWLKETHTVIDVRSDWVSCFRVERPKHRNCVAFLSYTGKLCIVGDTKETVNIGGAVSVVCSAFCCASGILVIGTIENCYLWDIDSRSVVMTVEGIGYTSFKVIDENRIVCGTVTGEVHIRSLPEFEIICHGETREKVTLPRFDHRYDVLSYKTAIISIDFCATRVAILCLSKSSELKMYDTDMQLLREIVLPFEIDDVCFQNGFGSVLVAAMSSVYTINWSFLFDRSLLAVATPLDDFDIRADGLETIKPIVSVDAKPIADTPVEDAPRQSLIMKRKLPTKNSDHIDNDDALSVDLEMDDHQYDNLVIEENAIPKRHFAPPGPDDVFWTRGDFLEETNVSGKNAKVVVASNKPEGKSNEWLKSMHGVGMREDAGRSSSRKRRSKVGASASHKGTGSKQRPGGTASARLYSGKTDTKGVRGTDEQVTNLVATDASVAKRDAKKAVEDRLKNLIRERGITAEATEKMVSGDLPERGRHHRTIEKHYSEVVPDPVHSSKVHVHTERAKPERTWRPPAPTAKRTGHEPLELCVSMRMPHWLATPVVDSDSNSDSGSNDACLDIESESDAPESEARSQSSLSDCFDAAMFTHYKIDGFEHPFAGYRMTNGSGSFRRAPKKHHKMGTWQVRKDPVSSVQRIKGEINPPLLSIRSPEAEQRLVSTSHAIRRGGRKQVATIVDGRAHRQPTTRHLACNQF